MMSNSSEDGDSRPARQKLIRAGVDLVRERGVGAPIDVRLTDASERAGLTTGAAYKIWRTERDADGNRDGKGGQAKFQHDVAEEIMRLFADAEPDQLWAAAKALIAHGATLSALIRILAQQNLEMLIAKPNEVALLFQLYGNSFVDPDLRAIARSNYRTFTEEYEAVYRRVLDHYGLRMKHGLEIYDLAATLTAISDGFTLRYLIDEDMKGREVDWVAPDGSGEQPWPLFSVAVQSVFEGMTEQI